MVGYKLADKSRSNKINGLNDNGLAGEEGEKLQYSIQFNFIFYYDANCL